jgi:hypothetical protein
VTRPTTRDRTKLPAPPAPPQRAACGVRLDPATVDQLDALAYDHGALRSDIIRGAIALALRAPGKIKPLQ